MKIPLALCALAASVHAGQTCHSSSVPSAITNWSQPVSVPKHAPELGPLQSVTITLRTTLTGSVRVENP